MLHNGIESGHLFGETTRDPEGNWIEKDCILVHPGVFMSGGGKVEVSEADVKRLEKRYNSYLSKFTNLTTGVIPYRYCPPIQLDHSKKAIHTVGRLVRPITVKKLVLEGDSDEKLCAMSRVRIMGKSNVEKVDDGRWIHLSVGADFDEGVLSETSIVTFPAVADASMLSAGEKPESGDPNELSEGEDVKLSYKALQEKAAKLSKLHAYLTGAKHKLSEEDAEKKLNELSDEDTDKMCGECDEDEKKLSEEKELRANSRKAKLSALNTAKTELSAALKQQENSQTVVKVMIRLSAMKSKGKITPAEIKGLNIAELAAASPEVLEATLGTYEKREPVIDPRVLGSVTALSGAALAKQVELEGMEERARKNMTSVPQKKNKGKGKGVELNSDTEGTQFVKQERQSVDQGLGRRELGELHIIHQCLSEGKIDEAKEKLSKLTSGDKLSDSDAVLSMDEKESEKHLSALVDSTKLVQDNLNKVTQLMADLAD